MAGYDLSDFEIMEIDLDPNLINCDLNLNVTSAPEQLDAYCAILPGFVETTTTMTSCYPEEQLTTTLTEMTRVVDPLPMPTEFVYPYAQETEITFSTDKVPGPPLLTVTLVKPQMGAAIIRGQDQETTELLNELYQDADSETDSTPYESSHGTYELKRPAIKLQQMPADDGSADETETLVEFDDQLASPSDSMDTGFTFSLEGPGSLSSSVGLPADRKTEIERKATYIREVIEKRGNKPDDMSSKLKVHEVILVILLNSAHGDRTKDLQRILTFCDENGKETSGSECRHFKTLDTETMGLLWQKIKGNKKGNYDTFARAMRVRRERSEGFFDYLESGKGKRKRIYRFGDRSMEEMTRFKRTLKQMSKPQACSY